MEGDDVTDIELGDPLNVLVGMDKELNNFYGEPSPMTPAEESSDTEAVEQSCLKEVIQSTVRMLDALGEDLIGKIFTMLELVSESNGLYFQWVNKEASNQITSMLNHCVKWSCKLKQVDASYLEILQKLDTEYDLLRTLLKLRVMKHARHRWKRYANESSSSSHAVAVASSQTFFDFCAKAKQFVSIRTQLEQLQKQHDQLLQQLEPDAEFVDRAFSKVLEMYAKVKDKQEDGSQRRIIKRNNMQSRLEELLHKEAIACNECDKEENSSSKKARYEELVERKASFEEMQAFVIGLHSQKQYYEDIQTEIEEWKKEALTDKSLLHDLITICDYREHIPLCLRSCPWFKLYHETSSEVSETTMNVFGVSSIEMENLNILTTEFPSNSLPITAVQMASESCYTISYVIPKTPCSVKEFAEKADVSERAAVGIQLIDVMNSLFEKHKLVLVELSASNIYIDANDNNPRFDIWRQLRPSESKISLTTNSTEASYTLAKFGCTSSDRSSKKRKSITVTKEYTVYAIVCFIYHELQFQEYMHSFVDYVEGRKLKKSVKLKKIRSMLQNIESNKESDDD